MRIPVIPNTTVVRSLAVFGAGALLLAACGDDDASDAGGPTVSITSPADGATVAGSVQLAMSADGITIEEAGEANDGAGHFHVLADTDCLDEGTAIGKDADSVHFGGGQSEGAIYLGPGDHDLCLQVGDGLHAALDVTDTVSITVAVESQDQWCAVIDEVDALQKEVDAIEDFAATQVGMENISRLMAQLLDAMDVVDEEARSDLELALEFGRDLSQAFTDAADFDEAFEEVDALFEEFGDFDLIPGTDWVKETCGVDLED